MDIGLNKQTAIQLAKKINENTNLHARATEYEFPHHSWYVRVFDENDQYIVDNLESPQEADELIRNNRKKKRNV